MYAEEKRAEARYELSSKARLRQGKVRHPDAIVLDLSQGGCLIEYGHFHLTLGTITVTLPGFEAFTGLVRWIEGQTAGVWFDRPLHPAIVDHITGLFPRERPMARANTMISHACLQGRPRSVLL